jgi:hypothetical protein
MPVFRRSHCFASLPDNALARKLYTDVIKPVVTKDHKLQISSFLDQPYPEGFSKDIKTYIHLSNFVTAILTDNNPNVLYEVGLAVGFGKPIVLFTGANTKIPSMLRERESIIYDVTAPKLKSLRQKANEHIQSVLHGNFADERFQVHTSILAGVKSKTFTLPLATDESSAHATTPIDQAFLAYNNRKYAVVITLLLPEQNSAAFDGDHFFWLADSYFLLAEGTRGSVRQKELYRHMWEVSQRGSSAFPAHKALKKSFGLACLKLGRLEEAKTVFEELLLTDPTFHVANYNLACTYALMKETVRCILTLRDLFQVNTEWRFLARLDPDFDGVWKNDLFQRLLFPTDSLAFGQPR